MPDNAQVEQITEILTKENLASLRANFDQKQADDLLMGGFTQIFKPTALLMKGIDDVLRKHRGNKPISLKKQEIVIISLLVSQRMAPELGLHVYLGLAHGLSPREIGEIVLVVGVYAGVSAMAMGLETLEATLVKLKAMCDNNGPLNPGSVFCGLLDGK